MRPLIALAGGATAFCLVAILNCGGYRYGGGDQAFYVPAVVQHLHPDLFPRDRLLLHAQDRFMLFDDVMASLAGGLGISIPSLFFIAYLLGMLLLFGAIVTVGRTLYRSWWTVALLAALMTLRHRITQTGANSLEAYFQPRMLAFALGAWAIAVFLRGRGALALGLVAVAFGMHPTTALWFGIFIAAALVTSERRWRMPLLALGGVGAAAAIWLVLAGPLRGHLGRMDPLWASALAGKDYIFPSDWGTAFWLVNFGYLLVIAGVYRLRVASGIALPRERGLVAGASALALVFLFSVPLMSAGVALALQLQTSRTFWMLDFVTAVYLAWLFGESSKSAAPRRAVAIALITIAVARGVFVKRVEHAGDPVAGVGLPQDNWTDAMRWISRTPADTHVLADPGHAWKYGTSVRVAGERDVYLEDVKDLALALYSREVAMQALQRLHDARDFGTMTPEQLRALAVRYDLDYLVVERDVELPVVYRNDQFRVYSLGPVPK